MEHKRYNTSMKLMMFGWSGIIITIILASIIENLS